MTDILRSKLAYDEENLDQVSEQVLSSKRILHTKVHARQSRVRAHSNSPANVLSKVISYDGQALALLQVIDFAEFLRRLDASLNLAESRSCINPNNPTYA